MLQPLLAVSLLLGTLARILPPLNPLPQFLTSLRENTDVELDPAVDFLTTPYQVKISPTVLKVYIIFNFKESQVPVELNSHQKWMKRNGDRYLCTFPSPNAQTKIIENTFPQIAEPFSTAKIATLLNPLAESCLYINKGWWSYEFCYLRQIRQYHKAQKEDEKNEDFLIGIYDPIESDSLNQMDTSKFYFQKYTDGDTCDLNSFPRESTVQFYCSPNSVDEIIDVVEVSTCKYLISIATARICADPKFVRSSQPVSIIQCSLVVSDAEYSASLSPSIFSSPAISEFNSLTQSSISDHIFGDSLLSSIKKMAKKPSALDALLNGGKDESDPLNSILQKLEDELFGHDDNNASEEFQFLKKILKSTSKKSDEDEGQRKKKNIA